MNGSTHARIRLVDGMIPDSAVQSGTGPATVSTTVCKGHSGPLSISTLRKCGIKVLWRTTQAIVLLSVLPIATNVLAAQSKVAPDPVASVNPIIGTSTGPGGGNNLFPGVSLPFGMVQISPDTEEKGYGYHYEQNTIKGFSMTHMSGPGCSNEGEVFFTATTGPVLTQISDFQSPYAHSDEAASPGYYRVRLSRWDINVGLTATDRTGAVQFTFPAGKAANVLLPISHTLNDTVASHLRLVGDRQINGYVINHIFCGKKQTYKVYFEITFDRPFSTFGTWNGSKPDGPGTITADSRTATQLSPDQWVGAYVSWPAAAHSQTVNAKIAISYVDSAGAKNNLKAETAGKSFTQMRSQARATWSKALSVIDVTGGSAVNRTVFYTALYHSLMMPNIFSDADGRYLGFDGMIHQAAPGHLVYDNYSGWDMYRSQMPLVAMIDPRRMEDMAQSVVLMYKQGGWIGRWPQANSYTNEMAGSPLTVVVSTAWLDGLHGFDIKSAWQGMLLDATHAPPPGHTFVGELGIDWINKLHYVPDDKVKYGSVSQLQEDVVAYASLYRLAVNLGKKDDAAMLYQRALYYRNLFNSEDRYFRPRNADGQWVEPFDPIQEGHGFIEGSGWHYQWMSPSDMAWLVQAVGPDLFNQRLSEFFNYKKPGTNSRYYSPYNETDMEAPFEFNFSGKPWESQRVVRRILTEVYTNTPDGIPGNDDCGEMSAWAVFSMMGMYPVDPASLAYELVSPVFPKVVLYLHAPYAGKSFTVETSAPANNGLYIEGVQLNGKAHQKNWISFHDIAAGGTLHFKLGPNPNPSWGSAAKDAPPSLSDVQP